MPAPIVEPTLFAEMLKLIPIVAGAMLAIFGGVMAQVLTHYFSEEREKKKLIREKGEALVQALYEYSDWLAEKNSKLVYTTENHNSLSPLDKAWMLQKLYFPELRNPILSIMGAGMPMVEFTINQRIAQLQGYAAWAATMDLSPYQPMYQNYLGKFDAAIIKISDHLKSYNAVTKVGIVKRLQAIMHGL